ncbi:MAG: FAD-dependent oxidoreductase, partial [Fidelibacterota bacterium]
MDIIGAGISGLATAYYLAREESDIEIHIWEKEPFPGGLAGTFSTEDFTVEKFYHHMFRRDKALQGLIKELDLEDRLIWRPAATGAYYFRQPYRLSSPLDLLRFKPLPIQDRLRLGWMVLHARRVKDWRELDQVSAKDYILKVGGEKVYKVVWEPLFRGKFGPMAESIAAAWLWSKLVDRGGSRSRSGHEVLGYLRGGLGILFNEMIDRLREMGHKVHLDTPIIRLEGTERKIRTLVTDNGSFEADLVISGVQVPQLVAMLPEQTSAYAHSLERINFLGNVCLVLTLNQSL